MAETWTIIGRRKINNSSIQICFKSKSNDTFTDETELNYTLACSRSKLSNKELNIYKHFQLHQSKYRNLRFNLFIR